MLSRKVGEKIIIGDDITVVILEVRGQIVRIGIDAPKDVSIYRGEVWLAIKKGGELDSGSTPSVVS